MNSQLRGRLLGEFKEECFALDCAVIHAYPLEFFTYDPKVLSQYIKKTKEICRKSNCHYQRKGTNDNYF